jgi:hypothetical protein
MCTLCYRCPVPGPVIDPRRGLSHTSQYALYRIFLNRALVDKARTMTMSEADVFFIPYDFGTDAAFHYSRGINPRNCKGAEEAAARLGKSPAFTKGNGSNHVLVVSINQGMNHFFTKECSKFLAGVCQNCIKLSIDDYSYLFGDSELQKNTHRSMEGLRSGRGVNWRAAPFPSDVHWSSRVSRPYPWEAEHNRDILVSFIGSNTSYNSKARRLRLALVKQCQAHSDVCYWLPYGGNKDLSKRDFGSINVENGASVHDIMRRSVFCLTPMGDLPTRKGLFDSILLGCIPVVFNPLTASVMYTWHWSEELWKEVLVEFNDRAPIYHSNLDIVDTLQTLFKQNRSLVETKQQLIRKNAFRLQYSLVEEGVTRPEPDAFDVSMQHIIKTVRGEVSGARVGSVPDCGFAC